MGVLGEQLHAILRERSEQALGGPRFGLRFGPCRQELRSTARQITEQRFGGIMDQDQGQHSPQVQGRLDLSRQRQGDELGTQNMSRDPLGVGHAPLDPTGAGQVLEGLQLKQGLEFVRGHAERGV